MNEEQNKQVLRELKIIRICVIIAVIIFVMSFLAQIFDFHLRNREVQIKSEASAPMVYPML
jgi:uncharacterized membrane protein